MTSVKTRVVIIATRCIIIQNLCITGIWNNKNERRGKLITNNDYTSCLYQFKMLLMWNVVLIERCFFQIMLFSEYILFSLDSVYIERWLVSWSWWHQTRYCPMCEAKHGSIAPPTTPHQLCRDTNSRCSASILHQPQYQMQCKPVLFNIWYSKIWYVQCETISLTIISDTFINSCSICLLCYGAMLGMDYTQT